MKKLLGISLLTVTCLYGLLAALVILIVILCGGEALIGIIIGIIVLFIQFLISPWLTDLSMRLFYKADFNFKVPDYLSKFIDNECKKHNIKTPRIGLIKDGGPNAFTYGRGKKDARIVLTQGIFDLLSEEEVISVVAHEMGHIAHRDMLFMTLVQVVPLVLYAIYEIFAKTATKNDSDDQSKLAIIGYVAYILYLLSQYIILWLSRTREYYADAFSIEETKNPNALAESLVKVGFGLSTNEVAGKHNVSSNNALGIFDTKSSKSLVVSCMDNDGKVDKKKIKNAMKWEMWNPWAKWFELNSTHPLISKRLIAISNRCEEFKQKPYIVFDLKKEESYVDDFLLEIFISILPLLVFVAGIVCTFVFEKYTRILLGATIICTTLTSYIKFSRSHRNKNYSKTTVCDLLGEVKVSKITSIPCTLRGVIIGRGNPGCIFNEDFIIKDDTGIIFLDYNQPLNIVNKIFALFKSKEYFDKEVEIEGWYRRSPVPYVEIKNMTIDGKTKKIWTYTLSKVLYIIFLVLGIILVI